MAASLNLGIIVGATLGSTFNNTINTTKNQLSSLGSEIGKLTREQRTLQTFSNRKDAAKSALDAVNATKQEIALLKEKRAQIIQQHRDGERGSKGTKRLYEQNMRALERQEKALVSLESKYERSLNSVRNYAQASQKAGVALGNHKSKLDSLGQSLDKVRAKQDLFNQAAAKRAKIGDAYASLKTGVVATAATGFALGSTLRESANFRVEMTRIGNTAEMTREQSKGLGDSLLAESKKVGVSVTTLREGLSEMVAGGLEPAQAIKATNGMGNLVKAYKADALDIGQTNIALVNNMGFTAAGLKKPWDILASAANQGNFELKDMAKALPSVGAAQKAFKLTGDEGAATAGAWLQIAKRGTGDAASAANNYQNFLQKFTAKDAEKNANKMGFSLRDTVAKAQIEGKNPVDEAIRKIKEVTGGDQVKLGELFADAQVQGFLRPAMQNFDEYFKIKDKALKGDGTVDKDASKVGQETGAKLDALGNSWENFKIKMGDALAPVFNRLLDFGTKGLDLLTGLSESPWGAGLITTLGAVGVGFSGVFSLFQVGRIAKFGLELLGLSKKIKGVGESVSVLSKIKGFGQKASGFFGKAKTFMGTKAGKGVGAAAGAYGLYSIARDDLNAGAKKQTTGQKLGSYAKGAASGAAIGMAFGPIGMAVGAVAGLVYTAVVRNWDKVKAYTLKKWKEIVMFAKSGIGNISKTILNWSPIGLFYKAFAKVLNWFGVKLPADFTGFGSMIIDGLGRGLEAMFPGILAKLSAFADKVKNVFSSSMEIHSPSRVFKGFGGYLMEGLSLGIDGKSRGVLRSVASVGSAIQKNFAPKLALPKIDTAAVLDGTSATPKPSAAGAVAQVAGGIVINIYQQAGQDAKDLAQEVMRLIEQKTSLRKRATIGDLA
jgi:TP901 family phage tail tape measure protein